MISTPKRALTAKEKSVKIALLSGKSINSLVRNLGIKKTNLYDIVDKLVKWGEIREVFKEENGILKPLNPRCFEDPALDTVAISKDIAKTRAEMNEEVIEKYDPAGNPIPKWNSLGISTEKVCPEGYIGGHINGDIEFKVIEIGGFGNIKGPDGLSYGYFSKETKRNGTAGYQRTAELRMFGQIMHGTYRWFESTGNSMFILYPERLFFDIKYFHSRNEVREAFIERANFVAYLLRLNGWIIEDPEIHGEIHYPFSMPGLAQHFDPEFQDDSADLICDTSLGSPEVELTHEDDPLVFEKAQIINNLPTEIMQLKATDAKQMQINMAHEQRMAVISKEIDELKKYELEQMQYFLDLRKTVQETSKTLMENMKDTIAIHQMVGELTKSSMEQMQDFTVMHQMVGELTKHDIEVFDLVGKMSATLSRLATVQDQQIGFVSKQLKLNNELLKIHSSDTELKIASTQQSLDDFVKKVEETPKADPNKRLEGYQ